MSRCCSPSGHAPASHEEAERRLNRPVLGDAFEDVADAPRGPDGDRLAPVELRLFQFDFDSDNISLASCRSGVSAR